MRDASCAAATGPVAHLFFWLGKAHAGVTTSASVCRRSMLTSAVGYESLRGPISCVRARTLTRSLDRSIVRSLPPSLTHSLTHTHTHMHADTLTRSASRQVALLIGVTAHVLKSNDARRKVQVGFEEKSSARYCDSRPPTPFSLSPPLKEHNYLGLNTAISSVARNFI